MWNLIIQHAGDEVKLVNLRGLLLLELIFIVGSEEKRVKRAQNCNDDVDDLEDQDSMELVI